MEVENLKSCFVREFRHVVCCFFSFFCCVLLKNMKCRSYFSLSFNQLIIIFVLSINSFEVPYLCAYIFFLVFDFVGGFGNCCKI